MVKNSLNLTQEEHITFSSTTNNVTLWNESHTFSCWWIVLHL